MAIKRANVDLTKLPKELLQHLLESANVAIGDAARDVLDTRIALNEPQAVFCDPTLIDRRDEALEKLDFLNDWCNDIQKALRECRPALTRVLLDHPMDES
jgi:hypothetical protein